MRARTRSSTGCARNWRRSRASRSTCRPRRTSPSARGSRKTQYQYTLADADSNELQSLGRDLSRQARGIPGITDVASDQANAGPLLDITVDRDAASSFGILPPTIDNTLDDAFGQRIVSTIFTPINQYHVVLEVDPQFQYEPSGLSSIYVTSSAGQQVPLSTLVQDPSRRWRRSSSIIRASFRR